MRNLLDVARAAVAAQKAADAEQTGKAEPYVVLVPALPIRQPTPWPGYRRWRIHRANGETFGVTVPQGSTVPEMTAFFCGCTCIPER